MTLRYIGPFWSAVSGVKTPPHWRTSVELDEVALDTDVVEAELDVVVVPARAVVRPIPPPPIWTW
jgi:hypothetical protein